MKKIITILTLIVTILAQANDGVYYTSGNQLVPLAETTISVSKEILTISILDNGQAQVDVYYEFLNPNATPKTLLMGFEADPSYNDDYKFHPNGKHPHIHNFTVEMNGQKITHKNAVSALDKFAPLNTAQWQLDDDMGLMLVNKKTHQTLQDYAYVYYFNATFQPGINRIHHTYSYTMSETVGTAFEIPYKLSPAGRWAGGQIGDFTLIIRADKTAKHFLVGKESLPGTKPQVIEGTCKLRDTDLYETPMWEVSLRNGAIQFHATNFRPNPNRELHINAANVLTSFNEQARFGEFYDRSSVMDLYIYEMRDEDEKPDMDFVRRIAHNLPYANRGRVFHNPEVKKYIESLWWYMPDPNYKDDTSDFTKSDWEYIRY